MRKPAAPLALFALLAMPVVARGVESIAADHVTVSWVAPKAFGAEPAHAGIRFELERGWHVYWKNPGDSGAAPKFALSGEGAKLGAIEWPVPERIPFGDLVNLGYSDEVVFPFEVAPSGDRVRLRAKLEWLVCEEECIPGFGTLELDRPVRGAEAAWGEGDQARLARFVDRVPENSASPWKIVEARRGGTGMLVRLERNGELPESVDLYPVAGEDFSPQKPLVKADGTVLEAVFAIEPGRNPRESGAIVVVEGAESWELATAPIAAAEKGTLPFSAVSLAGEESSSYALLLLSAFAGGLLLNLMPCVFPVLSIKVLSVLEAAKTAGGVRRDGLLYTAGVLATFAALGALLLALRAAGAAVGWGFQLQSPAVVLMLAALFWLLAMNFLGVFEVGFGVMSFAGRHAKTGSSFATGMLSVFVAAPCTGPFMGSALAASATMPAPQAMSVFLGLGAGLAAPYLALTMSPGLLSRLPRSGAWMETVKQLLAFPLFATVLWLLWVLGHQIGDAGWTTGGGLLLALSFALWLGRATKSAVRGAAWAVAVLALAISIHGVRGASPVEANAAESAGRWSAYAGERIAAARSAGRPTFIDFTAAWCVTCQWNKKAVLDTPAAAALFERHGVELFRADWTNQDAEITEALASFGRNSVPLYVFQPGDGSSPRVLPQILTLAVLEDLFANNPEEKS